MLVLDVISGVGSLAVIVAVAEYRRGRKYEVAAFEDDLTREFRAIARDLPVHAFHHGGFAEAGPLADEHRLLYHSYFDLSNEQLWLGSLGRVSGETLELWVSSIHETMQLPAFSAAWCDAKPNLKPDWFQYLSRVVEAETANDAVHAIRSPGGQPNGLVNLKKRRGVTRVSRGH